MKTVNKPFRKKDAMQLVTGQPVYMDDLIPQDCLIVKLLRSPHANAIVRGINTAVAKKVPGIEAIFTWEDVPQDARRYTQAGQTYPEASPYDRLLIDRHVRFVGDVVAIVAGKDEKCVDKALKLIKVDYEVLEAVLDFHTAKDNPILVHPEDNWESLAPVGADNKRNLCAHDECGSGDIDAVLAGCDVVIDHVYHTKACQQAMMETFRTYCSIDTYGRLNVLSSTQIVFHARRNIANALHIPKSMVRVSKPRIGGGFGAKQTAVSEVYPAFVTWMTKKPSKIIFSRVESQTASSPRHEMEMHVRLGATKDGIVKGIDYSPVSVEKSKRVNKAAVARGRCDVLCASVAELPFESEQFDLVTAFETVYFWPDLPQCFCEVGRVLKTGGTLLICNESNGDTDRDEKWTEIIGGMTIHKDTELKAYLEQAGFHDVQIHKKKSWLCVTARK